MRELAFCVVVLAVLERALFLASPRSVWVQGLEVLRVPAMALVVPLLGRHVQSPVSLLSGFGRILLPQGPCLSPHLNWLVGLGALQPKICRGARGSWAWQGK